MNFGLVFGLGVGLFELLVVWYGVEVVNVVVVVICEWFIELVVDGIDVIWVEFEYVVIYEGVLDVDDIFDCWIWIGLVLWDCECVVVVVKEFFSC